MTSYCTAHDFMNEMSGAGRKRAILVLLRSKLLNLLKILGTRAGREYGMSRAMPLPCLSVWLSPPLRTSLARPSSPTLLVGKDGCSI